MAFRDGRERELSGRFGSQRISGIQLDFEGIVLFIGQDRADFIKFANLYQLKDSEAVPLFLDDHAALAVPDLLMQEVIDFRLTPDGLVFSLSNGIELCCRVNDNVEAVVSFDGYF